MQASTKDLPRPKHQGESWPVVCVEGLPSDTLHRFRVAVMNKATDKESIGLQTATSYERHIREFLDYLQSHRGKEPLDATTSDLRQYIKHCRQKGLTENTVNPRRSAVSRFYAELKVLAEDDVLPLDASEVPENPEDGYDSAWSVDSTEKSKRSGESLHYLPPEDVTALVNAVPAPKLRNKLLVRLAYQTGMRVSELSNIRVKRDLDRENREISVPGATSKGDSRTVAYKPTLDADLRRWIDGGYRDAVPYANESPYLFPTRQSEQISRETVRTVVRKAAENADLNHGIYTDAQGHTRTKVSPHILRHSMAVNSLKAGTLNVREIQEILGHSDLSVSEKYLKIASEDATDKYHEKGGPPEV